MNRSFTNLSDIFGDDSCSGQTTSLDQLFGRDEQLPIVTFVDNNHGHSHGHGHGKSTACKIRCTDILEHITTCPVCSKLYKPVDNEQYHEQQPVNSKNMVLSGFFLGILLLILLMLMKVVISNK
jgi:hypothetical protein